MQDGESLHPASYEGCSHAKRITAQKDSTENSDQQHWPQPSQQRQQQTSGINTHQDTNQISGQSVHTVNVNINAMDDVFLAFTTVQQIMTALRQQEGRLLSYLKLCLNC
jgi:hypothetical protein